jgi:uncharacterized phage infection (PIP) family protein YhgE
LQAFIEHEHCFKQIDDPFEELYNSLKQPKISFKQIGISFKQLDDSFEELDNPFKQIDDSFEEADNSLKQLESSFKQISNSLKQPEGSFEQSDNTCNEPNETHQVSTLSKHIRKCTKNGVIQSYSYKSGLKPNSTRFLLSPALRSGLYKENRNKGLWFWINYFMRTMILLKSRN